MTICELTFQSSCYPGDSSETKSFGLTILLELELGTEMQVSTHLLFSVFCAVPLT